MSFNRPKVNLIIDVVGFICAALLITTWFLLEYVLPPGSGRLRTEGFGIGPGVPDRSDITAIFRPSGE
jgi:hypothetical protein